MALPGPLEERMQELINLDDTYASITTLMNIRGALFDNAQTAPDTRDFPIKFKDYLKIFVNNCTLLHYNYTQKRYHPSPDKRRILLEFFNKYKEIQDSINNLCNLYGNYRINLRYMNVYNDTYNTIKINDIGLDRSSRTYKFLQLMEKAYSLHTKPLNSMNLLEKDTIAQMVRVTTRNRTKTSDSITQEDVTNLMNSLRDTLIPRARQKLNNESNNNIIQLIQEGLQRDNIFLKKMSSITNNISQLYNTFYLISNRNVGPLIFMNDTGEIRDGANLIYNIYYSLKMLIKLVSDVSLDANGSTISRDKDLIKGIAQYDMATAKETFVYPNDNNAKMNQINAYNSLTEFYDKYIKPNEGRDIADVSFMRSHFYPAIKTMYDSLPTVGALGFITRKRGVTKPRQNGGLRYARRKIREL